MSKNSTRRRWDIPVMVYLDDDCNNKLKHIADEDSVKKSPAIRRLINDEYRRRAAVTEAPTEVAVG